MIAQSSINLYHLLLFMQKKKQKLPRITPFIQKLGLILQQQQHSKLISWLPCGTIFAIHKPQDFAAHLLPKYFKHNNYGSFLRQLNFYNFIKVIRTTCSGHQFQHPLFLRGQQQKHCLIKSEKSKKDLCVRQPNEESRNIQEQVNQDLPVLDLQISQLRRNQSSLLSQCRDIIDQGIQTIQWGLITSAEIQNDSSSNRLICNRIFDFLDQYPQMAGHISYLDTGIVHKLLEHLDTDIADFLNSTQYSPIISKLFSLVENNQLPINNNGFGVDRRKKKSYTIMRKEESQGEYSCAIIRLKEEI